MTQSAMGFSDLLAAARHSAVHLEMRDTYAVADEAERIEQWRAGHRLDPADRASWWRPWLDTIATTVARGVVVRRARIVSEPVSEYTRYLHSMTFTNVAAGEQVRWLPRMRASTIALPGSDFWLFDGKAVMFNHFNGDGDWADPEDTVSDDPAVAKLCAEAFETVWERAVPHEQYAV
ncbi:hypothetical protein P3T36_006376 [Kitasatospora sp. MAP12-15]|uniref:DUF6879 family protein n=1 Tax=unclassified Kitasatospora TaxID=2633591 RepID=UPI002476296D|nr:DUF6879 family protein [Kitasatospora sp. MAP12-44]MDH6107917.1 hypothetical protein [Kitasatospora sp. MAP12-44]